MTTRHTSERFPQPDWLVLDYLRLIADSEGNLKDSTYSIARDLDMHRQKLSRILQRLAKTGAVTLDDHVCRPIRVTRHVTKNVTRHVTRHVTKNVTKNVTQHVTPSVTQPPSDEDDDDADAALEIGYWSITCTVSLAPRYVSGGAENTTLSREPVTLSPESVTFLVTIETPTVTDKKETKQKNEEIPPAPPKEEKKQKKEKKPPTTACAREEISTKNDEERLERRRQHFIDTLQPFAERYGQEMITQFAEYWTEPNRSNTRMRFELQRTWNTSMRLARWARNDYNFNSPSTNSNNHDNSSHHDYNNNGNNNYHRPTSTDYVRAAQEYAIAQTEQFIREAESRRGGVPPHLPF